MKSETFENDLAPGLAAFDQRMGTTHVGRIDRTEVFPHSGFQDTLINQIADPIEQVMLFDHVRGFVQRAGEHQLPMQRQRLALERHHVEAFGIVNHPQTPLWLKKVFNFAFQASRDLGHSYVGPEHLLIGLASVPESIAGTLLKKYGVTPEALRQKVVKVVGKGAEDGRVDTPTGTPTLDKFGRDLTSLAREGKLDPVLGRAQEIENTIEVLARRRKNNPVLIGEPGVGKTAIVEGLAQRIVKGDVPEILRGRRLVEINLNSMVAGSKYRGEFEERAKQLLDEVAAKSSELILAFILGCVPLAIAVGASENSRHSIGTGVIGGMLAATVIAIFFIPLFYYLVERMTEKKGAVKQTSPPPALSSPGEIPGGAPLHKYEGD